MTTSLAETLRPLLGAQAQYAATHILCSRWYDDLVERLTNPLAANGQANTCGHDSATGVDTAPTGPAKVWACDHCGLRWREDGGPVTPCPGGLRLCGVPCGCQGRNPSHYPRRAAERDATLADAAVHLRAAATGRAPSEGARRGLRQAADLVEAMRREATQ